MQSPERQMDLKQQIYSTASFVGITHMLCPNIVLALEVSELTQPGSPPPPIFDVMFSVQLQELASQFYSFSFTRLLEAVYHSNYERVFWFCCIEDDRNVEKYFEVETIHLRVFPTMFIFPIKISDHPGSEQELPTKAYRSFLGENFTNSCKITLLN